MCLTEPGAGSDLSRARCSAKRDGDAWHLNGEKIFISGGDQDMSEDVLHLVLARTGAPEEGIKGLSLFLTAKSMAGPAIKITRIEEKLGLHASPTCHMVFDDAPAELVGVDGEGLKAMFTLMNHARIDVALQGVAHAARVHAIAAAYAAERKQGRKADRSDAVLSDHPDAEFKDMKGVWERIQRNLEYIASYGGILELNSSALRKGLAQPYPCLPICQVGHTAF